MGILSNFLLGSSAQDAMDTFNDVLSRMLPENMSLNLRNYGLDRSQLEAVPFNALSAPATYQGYVDQIGALLTGTPATRQVLGLASDGATTVYSWTVGAGTRTVLMTAGMHSGEYHGQLATIRLFEWIAKRADPLARKLYASYKFIMVPNVNPFGYSAGNGGRTNANGININRQFPYFWAQYDQTQGTDNAKGSAALSEVEAQYIQNIFVNNDVRVYLDSHNMGTTGMTADLVMEPPSSATYSNRQMVFGAMKQFEAATGRAAQTLSDGASFEPTGINYASHYMINTRGNADAVSCLFECLSNGLGSNNANATAALMTTYCNGMLSVIRAHMEGNGRMDQRVPFATFNRRDNLAGGVSLATGGTLIDVTTATPIQYDTIRAITIDPGTYRPYVDMISPCPGIIYHRVSLDLISSGAAQAIDFALSWNGAVSGLYSKQVFTDATNNRSIPVSFEWMTWVTRTPDASTIDRFAITAKKQAADATNPRMGKMMHSMQFFPYWPTEKRSAQALVPQPLVA